MMQLNSAIKKSLWDVLPTGPLVANWSLLLIDFHAEMNFGGFVLGSTFFFLHVSTSHANTEA